LGRAELLREGTDVALIALGSMVSVAYEVAERLAAEGVSAAVLNARFVRPLDIEAISALARQCGRVVTLEENVRRGGFGELVRDALAVAGVSVPVEVISLPDAFIEHGTQPLIRAEAGLDAESVLRLVSSHVRTR
jgi:1-deoxy-D-xylulose-5-phosphate synthase